MAAKKKPNTPENALLETIRAGRGRNKRQLTDEDRDTLIRMLAVKVDAAGFDVRQLAPQGSYIARMLRHFDDTDISYALPLMQLVMVAASWLTQIGAHVDVPGLGRILPSLWTVGLAESGEAKTLASEEVMRILSLDGTAPVELLPTGSSDAQWIQDLSEFNGSYWFQDEVGKFLRNVLTNTTYQRIKPWMLDAYSHKPIGNRLKSEKQKLVIEKPIFTFYGLSVFSTWKTDIDLTSMLDGFCQRMNYFIAPGRGDTDMFDHFLYFTGSAADDRRRDLHEVWQALCSQDGAAGPYALAPEVIPFLEDWWRGLRPIWGDTPLPKSFIRRTGFSIMRYLPTLHFLLGKSRYPIDLETAQLATRFAQFHFESTLAVLQDYNQAGTGQVQRVVALRDQLQTAGKPVSARNITRRLSAAQRADLPTDLVKEILAVLDKIEDVPGLIDETMAPREKSSVLVERFDEIRGRLKRNERKRNERRLRNLLRSHRLRRVTPSAELPVSSPDACVVELDAHREQSFRRANG